MISKNIFLYLILLFFGFLIYSCSSSKEPAFEEVTFELEIISNSQTPVEIDTNLFYIREFISWNTQSSNHDTLRADSLAQYFTTSPYKLSNMWFPHSDGICTFPERTQNYVIIQLEQPDSTLLADGYQRFRGRSLFFCFPLWRNYRFIYTTL